MSNTDTGGVTTNFADDDEITERDDLPLLIIPGYDRYSVARAINGKSHEDAMKVAYIFEKDRKTWGETFKRIYENAKK